MLQCFCRKIFLSKPLNESRYDRQPAKTNGQDALENRRPIAGQGTLCDPTRASLSNHIPNTILKHRLDNRVAMIPIARSFYIFTVLLHCSTLLSADETLRLGAAREQTRFRYACCRMVETETTATRGGCRNRESRALHCICHG